MSEPSAGLPEASVEEMLRELRDSTVANVQLVQRLGGQHPEAIASGTRYVNAATALLSLVDGLRTQRDDERRIKEGYAQAARVIHLYLSAFCDESLTPDEMIAEASRQAAAALSSRDERIEALTAEREALFQFVHETHGVPLIHGGRIAGFGPRAASTGDATNG